MFILIAILGTLGEAIFTALEVALGALSRARLRAIVEAGRAEAERPAERDEAARQAARQALERAARAERVLRVLRHPARLSLVFITITSLSMWAAAAILTWQWLVDDWPDWVLPMALAGVVFVAEVPPLLIAGRDPEAVALRLVGLAELSLAGLAPLLWTLGGASHAIARLLGAGPHPTPQVTEGELRTALAAAEEEGVIETEERAMIESAMDFRAKQVREVMTPRRAIVAAPATTGPTEVLRLAMRAGHSRLPVYDGTLDNVTGILSIKDLIPFLRDDGASRDSAPVRARDVARRAYFVPQDKGIAPTLDELRRQRTLMAIVVDAAGHTAGLVTLEDLLEEIVGDIPDEYDQDEPPLCVVEAGAGEAPAVLCDADVTVRAFERFWSRHFHEKPILRGAEAPDADMSQPLGAIAQRLFDGVPRPGDRVVAGVLEPPGGAHEPPPQLDLEVVAMNGPRIEKLKFTRRVGAE